MSGFLSYVPGVSSLVGGASRALTVNLDPVETHNIETNPDRRARCLKHLIKANHVNYAVIYHDLEFDNHNAHVLSSAYILGAGESQLHEIFDQEIKELEAWTPSPQEIIDEDWRDFLGDRRYQRAYLDYYEDKLAMEFSYNWKKEVEHFMFDGKRPLFHGLIGGLGHPLIHLGYAYEMDSKEIAMEALAMASVQYNFFHKYLDEKPYSNPSSIKSNSPTELLNKMANDDRFNRLPQNPQFSGLEEIFDNHQALIMEYWNGWDIDDPTKQFNLSQEAAVALLVATVRPGTHAYNFVLVHLLTTSHAVRVLLPLIPPEHHVTLIREWWLLVIAMYLMKGRPEIDPDNVDENIGQKHWQHVESQALTSKWRKDSHYVKAVRAMRDAAQTWGDVHEQYLRAAVTFVDNFEGWTF